MKCYSAILLVLFTLARSFTANGNQTNSSDMACNSTVINIFVGFGCKRGVNNSVVDCIYKDANLTEFPQRSNMVVFRKGIHRIDLSHNRLTQVPANRLHNLSINALNLEKNLIQSLHVDSFRSVVQLIELNLSFNNITELSAPALYPLRGTLRYLILRSNRIQTINAHTFDNFSYLKQLDLSDNQISIIHSEAFVGLNTLARLNLESNLLRHIPARLFFPLVGLIWVNLNSQNGCRDWLELDDYAFERDSSKGQLPSIRISLICSGRMRLAHRVFCSQRNTTSPFAAIQSIRIAQTYIDQFNSCIFRQLSNQTEVVFRILNECDCQIARVSHFAYVSGQCSHQNGSFVPINQYKCSETSEVAHRLCENQHEFDCSSNDNKATTSTIAAAAAVSNAATTNSITSAVTKIATPMTVKNAPTFRYFLRFLLFLLVIFLVLIVLIAITLDIIFRLLKLD